MQNSAAPREPQRDDVSVAVVVPCVTSLRVPRIVFAAAIFISLCAGVLAARNRIPWSDEGWFSSGAYNLAHHGFFGTTVLEPQGTGFTRIDRRTYWVMPLYLVGQALWYKVFSATILSTRSFSLFVWYPIGLAAFWLFLSRLKLGPGVPLLGTMLLATSFIFIDNAAFARPDLMCCALGFAGMAAYLNWRETHFYRALFAGNLLVAASGLTHPNGIFHFLGLLVLVLWFDRRRVGWRALAAFALPYLLLGTGYGLWIARDLPAFRDQMLANGTNGRWSASFSPITILQGEVLRYLTAFGLVTRGIAMAKVYALTAYVGAVAACLATPSLRSLRSVRLLLTLLACYFAAMCVFNQKLSYYLIHILPLYIALLAVWINWIWTSAIRLRRVVVMAVAALMTIEVSGSLAKALTRSYQVPQRAAVAFIRSHARPDDRICGSAALIYEMDFDPRLRDDPFLGLKSGRLPDVVIIETLYHILYDAWSKERPVEMRAIRERLQIYQLAYHDGDYEVYLRRTLAPSTPDLK
jgi:hypothetical protein